MNLDESEHATGCTLHGASYTQRELDHSQSLTLDHSLSITSSGRRTGTRPPPAPPRQAAPPAGSTPCAGRRSAYTEIEACANNLSCAHLKRRRLGRVHVCLQRKSTWPYYDSMYLRARNTCLTCSMHSRVLDLATRDWQ